MSKIIDCKSSKCLVGNECKYALDGREDTLWSAGDGPTQWIEVTLDSPCTNVEIAFTPAITWADHSRHNGTVAFNFEWFDDKRNVINKTFYEKDLYDKKEEQYNLTGVGIKYIRLTFTSSPSWVALYEIKIIDQSSKEMN